MARLESIEIVRHVPIDGLNGSLDVGGMSPATAARARERLAFVRMRYLGYSVREASEAVGISVPTGYSVQRAWNEGGPAALAPGFGGGREPRLTDAQKADLAEALRACPLDTADAARFIAEEYGVRYSSKQVHVILSGMGLRHAKPYPGDFRRPDDAEAALKKRSRMVWTA